MRRVIVGLLFLGMAVSSVVMFQKTSRAYDQGVQKKGVVFNMADDRKMEKIGGIYEPEGIDKYMKRKFDHLESRLEDLQKELIEVKSAIAGIEGKMDELLQTTKSMR